MLHRKQPACRKIYNRIGHLQKKIGGGENQRPARDHKSAEENTIINRNGGRKSHQSAQSSDVTIDHNQSIIYIGIPYGVIFRPASALPSPG